jgi:hypothetical protein
MNDFNTQRSFIACRKLKARGFWNRADLVEYSWQLHRALQCMTASCLQPGSGVNMRTWTRPNDHEHERLFNPLDCYNYR